MNQPLGGYPIQAFDAPAGLPNSSYLINVAGLSFWMAQPTGITGFLFPEVKLFLNGPSATPICSMTSNTPLPTIITGPNPYNLSCTWTGFWPNPIIKLHWEAPALRGLNECLNAGWRDFGGSSCHE